MKNKTHQLAALMAPGIFAAFSFTPLAYGEEVIDEVVVTATRYERNMSDIGSSIAVITAEELDVSD